MSKKTIIGLTGNIGTGKSTIRKMLEHLGAYGIDADALSHRIIAKGGPAYQKVVDQFGNFILSDSGEIDRAKLGKVVFTDPDALASLEAIVHPFVRQAIQHFIKKAHQEVIVIEAIKLLESPTRELVDSIWVVTSPADVQIKRLVDKRGMPESDALQRMAAQGAQEEKAAQANVIIKNDGSIDETWKKVANAWKTAFPDSEGAAEATAEVAKPAAPAPSGKIDGPLSIERAKPRHAAEIASLITRISAGQRTMSRIEVMEAFGEKAFMLLMAGDQIAGVMGWQVENLVARTDDIWFETGVNAPEAIKIVMPHLEEASQELQAEALLVFAIQPQLLDVEIWTSLGYEQRTAESLNVSAWQEAARDYAGKSASMFFKQLRVDRVLRPM